MKKSVLYLCLLTLILGGCQFGSYPSGGNNGGYGSGGNTGSQYPTGGGNQTNRPADPSVRVQNIRLTPDYTILDLSYTDPGQPQYDQRGQQLSTGFMAFHPSGQLVAANGARTFRFLKADNIPIEPQRQKTYAGQTYNFSIYFERLDKGLEQFDLFECNDYDHIICWNVYNLAVRNPADRLPAPVPTPTPKTPTPLPTPTKTKTPGETPIPTPTPVPTPTPPASVAVVVTGVVRDEKTNRPVSATIDYKLSSKKISVDSVQSFASTGAYRMTINKGQVYTYVASAKGYLPTVGTLDLSKVAGGERITRDIVLKSLVVGDKITLQNIYFEASKSDLLSPSFAELNKLVTMMRDNPAMRIRLEGHTDVIGDHEANLQLSRDRVLACQKYMINQGVDNDRIDVVGYGDTKPIVPKGTDEQRKVNRRVEFVVLSV
jgi:OmpA-OmpF porin, OOP family